MDVGAGKFSSVPPWNAGEGYTSIELVTRRIEFAPWHCSNVFRPRAGISAGAQQRDGRASHFAEKKLGRHGHLRTKATDSIGLQDGP